MKMPPVREDQPSGDPPEEDKDPESNRTTTTGQQPYYITVTDQDGAFSRVRIEQPEDQEQFSTNRGLLNYLAQKGEIRPRNDGSTGGSFRLSPSGSSLRRGSILPDSLLRRGSNEARIGKASDSDKNAAEEFDLDEAAAAAAAATRGKRGSIVTPELISHLKQNRKRLVAKSGALNVALMRVQDKRTQFAKDFFNTVIDMQWRYTFGMFFASFFLSWLLFGVVYYLIAIEHGDLEEDNLPSGKNQGDGSFKPCVWAIEDFTSCFLFSVETQHTIG